MRGVIEYQNKRHQGIPEDSVAESADYGKKPFYSLSLTNTIEIKTQGQFELVQVFENYISPATHKFMSCLEDKGIFGDRL